MGDRGYIIDQDQCHQRAAHPLVLGMLLSGIHQLAIRVHDRG